MLSHWLGIDQGKHGFNFRVQTTKYPYSQKSERHILVIGIMNTRVAATKWEHEGTCLEYRRLTKVSLSASILLMRVNELFQ